MTQGIEKQGLALATIEAERHFIQIGWEMFSADLVPRSHSVDPDTHLVYFPLQDFDGHPLSRIMEPISTH